MPPTNDSEQASAQPPSALLYWTRAFVGTPLLLLGGFVTLVGGFILCAYLTDRATGGGPEPKLLNLLLPWLIFGAGPLALGRLVLAGAPGIREVKWIFFVMLFLFVVVGVDASIGPKNWHQVFRREKLPGTDAGSLKQTIVSSHLDVEIVKGRNVLWCGTFQLAWNEACRLAGGDLAFSGENQMISALNKHSFTKESLDEPSYLAMAGFIADNIHERIRKALDQKFHGVFKPQFVPDKALTPRPQDFVAYACLYKHLSFETPFERLNDSLTFGGVRVSAFGMEHYKQSIEKMYPQVLILHYESKDDFVVELKTKSDSDRLILAKMPPQATVEATITAVGARIAPEGGQIASTNDVLIVPRIKLDLTRRYSELEGLRLIPKGTNVAKDLLLASAVQNTLFEMSEKGVELRSESHMAFACSAQKAPVTKHEMIFDKPFLILMQRHDSKMPYFALWVDNPELLIAWK